MSATDRITISGLVARGHHGVLAEERRDGQDFVVDAEVELDTRAAAATDDLSRSIHYGELATALAEAVRTEPVDLLETLAERLARICLADERAVAARVVVHKPQAPIPETFADVAVTVRRARAEVYPAPRDGVLALGSNLGDRAATLAAAVRQLAGVDGLDVLAVSPVVETDPVLAPGSPPQPEYLNAVVAVRASLTPQALLAACLSVERAHGRERRVRWAARTLDVDVVSYGGLLLETPDLVLPHPRAAARAFVLAPWVALDPGALLPGPGGAARRVAELLAGLPPEAVAGVRPRPDIVLLPPAPAARPAPDPGTATRPPTRSTTRSPAEEALP